MSKWQIIDSGSQSAEESMRQDALFLETADQLPGPVLHFYEWARPSATYGHFADPGQWLDLEAASRLSLDLARRPTGGGIVFHLFDMAFSVVIPASSSLFSTNTLDNYAFVNQAVLDAVRPFLDKELTLISQDVAAIHASCTSFCMAKPTKYDVVWGGKKVAGAAQRKTRKGFLHQGTIALVLPSSEWLDQILLSPVIKEAMLAVTLPLLGQEATVGRMEEAKNELKSLLTNQILKI